MKDDQIFWERLEDMPDIEALQELSQRRESMVARKTEIIDYWRGRFKKMSAEDTESFASIDLALVKINDEIKTRNRRMDNASWRAAVRAIYGEEGYVRCREWMLINGN